MLKCMSHLHLQSLLLHSGPIPVCQREKLGSSGKKLGVYYGLQESFSPWILVLIFSTFLEVSNQQILRELTPYFSSIFILALALLHVCIF